MKKELSFEEILNLTSKIRKWEPVIYNKREYEKTKKEEWLDDETTTLCNYAHYLKEELCEFQSNTKNINVLIEKHRTCSDGYYEFDIYSIETRYKRTILKGYDENQRLIKKLFLSIQKDCINKEVDILKKIQEKRKHLKIEGIKKIRELLKK